MTRRNGNHPNRRPRNVANDQISDSPTFDYIVPVDLGLTDTDRKSALRDVRAALKNLGFPKIPTVSFAEVGTYEGALGKFVDPAKVKYVTNHGVYDLHISVENTEGQPPLDTLMTFLDQLHARRTQPELMAHFPVARDGVMSLAVLERADLSIRLEINKGNIT